MTNFLKKLFRRNKEVEDENLFHPESSDNKQVRSSDPKKKGSLFHRDKKYPSSSENDGFGRNVELSTTNVNKKSGPPATPKGKSTDAASKRKRTEKNAVVQPSPNRLANSYHDHPFAVSSGKNDDVKANSKTDTKKGSSPRNAENQDRRDTDDSFSPNSFSTNFADFDSRESKMVNNNKEKNGGKHSSSSSSSLSYSALQTFDQQWTQSQAAHSKHSLGSSNDPFKGAAAQQKQVHLQRLPNGQLVIQPPSSSSNNPNSSINMNKRNSSVMPPPMSPSRMAALSPSAQSDFCLSTDLDDDEYNRLRKEAARNLSPMLDKATASDDEDDFSDEDDFYKITKNKYAVTNRGGGGNNKAEEKPYSKKNVGISGPPPQDSYSKKGGVARGSHYVSESEHEHHDRGFSKTNNGTRGGEIQQKNNNIKFNPVQRTTPLLGATALNQDYFSDSENEVDTTNQPSSSRFVFDSGFDDALVSNITTKPGDTGMSQEETRMMNRPPSPPSGPADRLRMKQQQYPTLQSSSRDKFTASSPNRTGSGLQPHSLPKRQGLNGTKVASSLYPDSSDSEDVILERMHGYLPKNAKAENNTVPVKQVVGGGHLSLSQSSSQEPSSTRSRGYEPNGVQNSGNGVRLESNSRSSRSMADPSPVLELLAQAKADRQKRLESSSVGGAPSLTAKYLREHHNLKTDSNVRQESSKGVIRPGKNEEMKGLDKLSAKITDDKSDSDSVNSDKNDAWLFDEVAGALGPRGIAADLESLGGKSNRSRHSIRSHKSKNAFGTPKKGSGIPTDEQSVGSRHSRTSRYSAKSSKSHFSHMSEQSRSVANDLIRLEMQLALIGSNGMSEIKKLRSGGSTTGENKSMVSTQSSRKSIPNSGMKAIKKTIIAPAGKLGIILANRTDSKGTVVSGVRTSSSLFDKIAPGDRIITIDGEDVTMMSVSEITSIMARKNDFERELVIISLPNHT